MANDIVAGDTLGEHDPGMALDRRGARRHQNEEHADFTKDNR
jgi:hypothetical protein